MPGKISVSWPTPGQASQRWLIRGNRKLHAVFCVYVCAYTWALLCTSCASLCVTTGVAQPLLSPLSKHNTCRGHKYSYRRFLVRIITPLPVRMWNHSHNHFKITRRKHKPGCCCCWCQSDWLSLWMQVSPGWVILHPWCPDLSVYPLDQK